MERTKHELDILEALCVTQEKLIRTIDELIQAKNELIERNRTVIEMSSGKSGRKKRKGGSGK